MKGNYKVRLLKKLNVTDLAGEKVMIDFATGKYFLLKGVANDIWEYIQTTITVDEIEERLLSEYEIDRKACHEAVALFLEQIKDYEFIELIE